MTKEEAIRSLRGAVIPEQIDRELLINYHKHLYGTSEEQREKIFDRATRDNIGTALKREWEKVTSLMEQGYDNIETPTGHRLYRHRKSKLYHKWQELIPDNMPVQHCKDIIKDICDRWEPSTGEKLTAQSNQEEPPF